ncbi:MAG: M15 family metallopeptidase, partial [Myxococcota bacterium]|nr:M15 family metallopeptidase [Myxococcota bacterium]
TNAAPIAGSAADASAPPATAETSAAPFPFGPPSRIAHYTCGNVVSGGAFRFYLAAADTRVAYVDGDDLLALVNRSPTGALPPTYAPSDLIDLHDGSSRSAAACESARMCLRRDAAAALNRMLAQMKIDGVEGRVQSAFRGFATQCWVFASWAHQARGGFCEATAQSALPGHSQHQLGTTLDLFTTDWVERGAQAGQGVFRNGFGCTRGGKWLDENAWSYGFVVSYPIHPDDRRDGSRCLERTDHPVPIDPKTGYKHEPWHVRFIGMDAATEYHEAWLKSAPGTPAEITLEQWLRRRRGLAGEAELPVCDGCQCGACATLAAQGDRTPCSAESLRLDDNGRAVPPDEEPRLLQVKIKPVDGALVVEATVHAPAHTPTQTPVTSGEGPTYDERSSFEALAPYPRTEVHRYDELPGAWRVAIEAVPEGPLRWPWRASLAKAELAAIWNRANVVLPAKPGDGTVRVRIVPPKSARALRVTLLRDAGEHEVQTVPLP